MPRLRQFAAIRTRLGVPAEMPPAAQQLAIRRAVSGPVQPGEVVDRREVELVSIDPEGSRDLDQALHLERDGSGYRFFFAIADVTADLRVPLHPLANECVLAACAGGRPAPWVTDALESLPAIMAQTSRHAHEADRAAVEVMEAAVLSGHEGEVFDAVVTTVRQAAATAAVSFSVVESG